MTRQLTCGLGHRWDIIPDRRKPEWGVIITLRCEHCGMIREDIINQFSGELDHRNYIHPTPKAPTHTLPEWRKIYAQQSRAEG